jgi:hypothetical protein
MHRLIPLTISAAALLWFSGCQVPDSQSLSSRSAPLDAAVLIPRDALGQHCVIQLKNHDQKMRVQNSGRVMRVDDESIVLSNVTQTVEVEREPPLAGQLPFLSRYFKNSSMARDEVPGQRTILRSEIAAIEFVEEATDSAAR